MRYLLLGGSRHGETTWLGHPGDVVELPLEGTELGELVFEKAGVQERYARLEFDSGEAMAPIMPLYHAWPHGVSRDTAYAWAVRLLVSVPLEGERQSQLRSRECPRCAGVDKAVARKACTVCHGSGQVSGTRWCWVTHGDSLKSARETQLKLTVAKLAEKLGLLPAWVEACEKGEVHNLDLDWAKLLERG